MPPKHAPGFNAFESKDYAKAELHHLEALKEAEQGANLAKCLNSTSLARQLKMWFELDVQQTTWTGCYQ
ncbi:MAG: hypothetical protein K2Z81_08545 [Cyanobacteria bacterium]|nr:hypothetical protein [Cyanobacteriota bacterium]